MRMQKRSRGPIQTFLLRYAMLFLFFVGIVVMNIWDIQTHSGTAENSTESSGVATTERLETTSDTLQTATTVFSALQTTAPTSGQSATTATTAISSTTAPATTAPGATSSAVTTSLTSATTAPPTPAAGAFQTVDASYFDDALFIGDSRSEGLALYGSLTNADYYTDVGMSVYNIDERYTGNPNTSESMSLTQKLSGRQYGKIYIMLGLNELGTGTAQSWADTYSELVQRIRALQPSAIIYLQSILPVSAAEDDPGGYINNKNVRERNAALQTLENPAGQIYYLSVSDAVQDQNGYLKDEYTSDGVHLLGNSLSIWESYLEQHAIVL